MKKRKIKKIGWIIFLLVFFIARLYLDVKLGISLIYEKYFDRSYIKIDQYNTITVWRNYIIFGEYHHIYHPKSNYIFVKDYIEHYDFKCSITQDSILAIWSTAKIEVYGLVEFKAIEIYEEFEYNNWLNKYSFINVNESCQDSLLMEIHFTLFNPTHINNGKYLYNTGNYVIIDDITNIVSHYK